MIQLQKFWKLGQLGEIFKVRAEAAGIR